MQKYDKIKDYLGSVPEGATPKMIALGTSLNVNTVKSILPKMAGVVRVIRGWYKIDNSRDAPPPPLTDWTFHNLIMSVQLRHYKNYTIDKEHGLIKTNITINKESKCTMRVACDTPLNIASISMCYAYFKEVIYSQCEESISPTKVMISTIEFNKDYQNLRLDGIKCISLDNMITQFKVYQKALVLRKEHKTKVMFNSENIVDLLTAHPNEIETRARLDEHNKILTDLIRITTNNHALVRTLINGGTRK